MRLLLVCLLVLTALSVPVTSVVAQEIPAAQLSFFESKIRPVLIEHCYKCHSADSEELKGNLALDTSAALLAGGDSGPGIVPGKPDESPLIEALRYDGLEMPPAGRLPDQVVRDFEKWVQMGAPDPRSGSAPTRPAEHGIDLEAGRRFWAFQPFQDHEPDLKHGRTRIDAFIGSKLASASLHRAAAADTATLVRRLYFDLIGLPPTADDLEDAVKDGSAEAIEGLVDRLLTSSQFGVHWGRHWLDVARYADSNGGDFNATFHDAWKYRDYIVSAMNQDKPFDRLIREQIAGDLVPFENDQQRSEQIIATGFLMLGTKMLSERDKDKLAMDVVDEQINTVGSAFLGMTLGCARCHDHKFDPIPTRDYYALAGIFRSTRTLEGESQKYVSTWRKTRLPAEPEHTAAVEQHAAETKKLEKALAAAKKQLTRLEEKSELDPRFVVDDVAATLVGNWKHSTYTPRYIGKGYIHDNREGKGRKAAEFSWTPPRDGLYEVRLAFVYEGNRAKNVPITVRHADGETNLTLDQTKKPAIGNQFAPLGRFRFTTGQAGAVHISTEGTTGYVIADAVHFVAIDDSGKPVSAENKPAAHTAALKKQRARVEELDGQLEAHRKQAPPPLPRAFAAGDHEQVEDCRICIRGEHRNRGDVVPRGFLQVVAGPEATEIPDSQSGRLELANWIASPSHPLTARVIVNRVWSHLIGQGLVRSVDNFGQLGERPTHPELLDHLASRFVTPTSEKTEQGAPGLGWSLKSLIREIVLTDVYQQSSNHNSKAWSVDPENRLLWKAHRRRIPAESLRDAMLSISGQLELSPGGSPVEGLGTLVKNNQPDAGEYQQQRTLKRSLYMPIIRNELPPVLTVFDFADPDLVVGKRPVTNVPAQALFLMNSPFVVNTARRTAGRLTESGEQLSEIVTQTYLVVLNRRPEPAEAEEALRFLNIAETAPADGRAQPLRDRLSAFVHALLASTEFRMLN